MKNLDDCLQVLESFITEDLDEWVKKDEGSAVALAHHGIGTRIRNELNLWEKNAFTKWFNKHGIYHADDMSGIILTSFHRKKNGKDVDLEGQIKSYRDYWESVDPSVNEGKLT